MSAEQLLHALPSQNLWWYKLQGFVGEASGTSLVGYFVDRVECCGGYDIRIKSLSHRDSTSCDYAARIR